MGITSAAPVTILGAFVVGVILVLMGSLRPLLVKRLQTSEAAVEWLISGLNVTLIPVMLLAGLLVDRFGVREVFFLGSILTAAGAFVLAYASSPGRVFGAILLTGAGAACLSNSSSVLMVSAFFPENAAASQNLGNVFFALGALTAPGLASQLMQRLDYRRILNLIAIFCLLPAVVALITQRTEFPSSDNSASAGSVLNEPVLWLSAIVLFIYGPLEDSLNIWAPRYLQTLGFKDRGTTWLLASFWFTFLLSRLASALLFKESSSKSFETWYIVLLAIAAGVLLGNLNGARSRLSASLGIILLGLAFGPIFPTLVGVLFDRFTEQRGTAFGAMFALGAIGKLFLPPFIGAYSRRKPVHQTMNLQIVLALIVALAAFVLALYPHLR
jgi:fucose permease